jgi:drug/metabolite transporter (DMT)-like permease
MITSAGLIAATAALIFWAIGDIFIQKGTRSFGNWATIFLIGAFGLIIIFPFIYDELPQLATNSDGLLLLALTSTITLFAALFLFEGLKRGKIAIIEPVFGLELPFTVAFSVVIGKEHLPPLLYFLIAMVFVGLMLAVTKQLRHLRFDVTLLEKGVAWAAVGSIAMGLMNFLTGLGSQAFSPLLTIWFIHGFVGLVAAVYLIIKGEMGSLLAAVRRKPRTAFCSAFFDNGAWIAYAYAMVLMPISLATAISESYIVFTVLAGVFLNREKIKPHQCVGIIIVVIGVIALGWYAP